MLAGGGHSHLAVLKQFGVQPLPGLKVTLVSRDTCAPYSGMLPGLIAGHYGYDDCHIDLRRLARYAGADFLRAEVTSLDAGDQFLHLRGRPSLHYDILSLNIGGQSSLPPVAGPQVRVFPVKPVDELLAGIDGLDRLVAAGADHVHAVVVGAGAGGVELILALQHRFQKKGFSTRCSYRLVTDQAQILMGHNGKVREHFERTLAERNVEVITDERVISAEAGSLRCASGREVPADFVVWAIGVAPPAWTKWTGLELNGRGFVRVDPYLRSTSHPSVYAAGDIASSPEAPRPKSGVYAVRQGSVLAGNLRRHYVGRSLKPYRPQTQALALISGGDRYAVASRGAMYLAGAWLWKLKNRIDRRFVAKYNDLPPMLEAEGATDAVDDQSEFEGARQPPMRCGGCGAKVGHTVLARVLERLAIHVTAGIDLGLEAMDDAAVFAPPPQSQKLVQSIDYFRDFINDPYLLGEIVANHALNDLYAMGARPHSALAVVTVPFAAESIMEQQLYQLMAGAVRTLTAAGATLLGGHSGEGAELAIGFSVTGMLDSADLKLRQMSEAGQVLILTKPLGTGLLFAADMRRAAAGRWIDAAVVSMRQSNQQAVECLRTHGATACTGVAGFGLIGHLLTLLRAKNLGADIELEMLPLLEGALECARAGIFSSLQPQNARNQEATAAAEKARGDPAWPLLFDPQTSGGLLAAVPAQNAQACIAALKALDYCHASMIGRIRAASTPRITVL